jgi:hypothetical protein
MACASVGTSAAQASTPAYTIEAFAGTGTAGPPTPGPATSSDLSGSYQVAVDTAGNVYVIDQGNYEVDKITPSGTLSIIAGTGTQGPPAAGPATSSPLGDPDGLAVDAAGNVYIADQTSAEVLKVTPAGALSIIAGTGTQGMPTPGPATSSDLETPSGLAVDPASDVYVADDGAAEIEKITPSGMLSIVAGTGTSGTPAAGPATSSPLGDPDGVAVDSAGNLFISDALDYVEEVTPAGNLSIFAGNGSSGNPVAGPATSSPLGEPYEISVDPAGDVDVADYNDIEQISPSGTLAIIAGDNTGGPPTYGQPSTSSALYYPPGVAVSPSGIVYIADYFNNTVDQLVPGTPASAVMPTISGSAVIGQTLTASVGSWSNEPTSYAYQWQDCDSSGANCVDIAGATASTYTVSALDLGHTIRVAVTASNGGGSASATSATTAAVVAAPITTLPTTTTTTSAPPVTTTGSGNGVSLSAQTARTGVTVSPTGGVPLSLVCPQTATGCDADGLLTLAFSHSVSHALLTDAATPAASSVIARFAGVQINAGHSRLVSVTLTPAATRYLQTRGIRRIRVTLTIHNHLTGGPIVTTTQQVWLNIAGLRASCPAATGTLTGSRIAQMRLDITRGQAHHLGRYRKAGFGFERYCLTGGAIRVRYPAAKLLHTLTAAQRHQVTGRIYLALTANKHYTAGRVRTGMTVTAAGARLRLGVGVTVGKNTWYLIVTKKAAWVLKAQHGIIREIGITRRSLTQTRQARQTLLHNI